MSVESSHLLVWKLYVQVDVESFLSGFTNHASSPQEFSVLLLVATVVAIDSVDFASHAINATLRYRWEQQACRQSPDTTSPLPHTKEGSLGNAPGVDRSHSVAIRGSTSPTEASLACPAQWQVPVPLPPHRNREVRSL